METHFKVLVSSNIRRKKPWSRLEWIGNVKESVCLMDRRRASILYLPSGHTKRVIDVFKPHKKNIVCINTSSSGEYVVACLASGEVLRWHKDTNTSTMICACPNFSWLSGKSSGSTYLYVSNDGRRIVSIVENHDVNVWEEIDDSEEGEWTRVGIDTRLVTALARKETAIDARFFSSQIQGDCFLSSFTFSDSINANICFLYIRWNDDPKPTPNAPTVLTSFSRLTYPLKNLHPSCQTLRARGCYVPRLSHDGRMMALAINQLQPYLSCVLFVNVFQQSAIATSQQHIYNDKIKAVPSLAKTYWMKMLAWSSDDLFLFCITRRGSLLLYNNAGEPMMGTTHGLGVELGPSYLLPIHPLVEPMKNPSKTEPVPIGRPSSPLSMASTLDSERSLKQKYSITTHPRLPIVLCSDGYMVTALQMTNLVTSHDIAALSLVETNRKMKLIIDKFSLNLECIPTPRHGEPIPVQDEAKFKEYKYTRLYLYLKNMFKRKKDSKEKEVAEETNQTNDESFNALVYEFEKAEKEDDVDTEPDSTADISKPTGVVEGADEGKITFGDYDQTGQDPVEPVDEMREDGESLLEGLRFCISKLLHSFALLLIEQSSLTHHRLNGNAQIVDKLHMYFIETLRNLCDLILSAQETSRCLPWNSSDDGEELDYREAFNELMKHLATKLAFLSMFNAGSAKLVTKAVEVVIGGTLQLCGDAAEGCTSMHDIHYNIATALRVLVQLERNMERTNRFHEARTPGNFHLLDVVDLPVDQFFLPHSKNLLVQFHSYLSNLYASLPVHQDRSSLDKVLSAVQRHLVHRVEDGGIEVVAPPLTLYNMSNNLMGFQLDAALHLASFVLYDHLNVKSKWSENAWKAAELLCTVMEQYFCKKSVAFSSPFPPSERKIVLHRDIITEVVSIHRLSRLWSAHQCVKMLLLCGRLQDASRLADSVGSWKVALSIGAAMEKVRAFKSNDQTSAVDQLLKERFKSLLPSWIILNQEEDDISQDDSAFSEDLYDYHPESSAAQLVDLFLAGVMTGYDIAQWGITKLLSSLKRTCRNLTLLEEDDVYLPSPPLYLPQPTPDDDQRFKSVLRHKISVQLRLILIVFHSVGAMQDLLFWYAEKLRSETSQPKSNQSQSSSDNHLILRHAEKLAGVFRDACAILWMLNVREKLTICVRNFQKLRARGDPLNDIIEECLLWSSQFKPFAKFLECEVELESLVLCVCSEKAVDRRLVSLLAYYFCDDDKVNPKLHSRLDVVLQRLRKTTMPLKNKSPRDSDIDRIRQPYSILYQKQCRVMLQKQKNDVTLQHLFVNNANDYQFCDTVSPFKPSFFFECDSAYQDFIGKLFDVIFAKSSAMDRAVQREGASMWPDIMLVGSNRRAIAETELDKALAYMHRQKYNSMQNSHDHSHFNLSPNRSSTPKRGQPCNTSKTSTELQHHAKNLKLNQSFQTDDGMTETIALKHYFSDRPITGFQRDDADDVVESIVDRIDSCLNFDISDVPVAMRKRFCRLLPYITWLQYWMEKDKESRTVSLKPSIHVSVNRQQLLQSMYIAEVRFGGYSEAVLNDLLSTRTSSVASLSQTDPHPSAGPTQEDNAKEETEIEAVDAKGIEIKEKLSTLHEEESDLLSKEEEESDTMNEVDEISEAVVQEEDEGVVMEEETKPKEIADVTLHLTSLKNEDESLSELADGGSSRKPRGRSPPSTRRDNLASVVRDEIHNVLLAQQVSLLSQILLGQTMTGGGQGVAQMSDVAEMLKNLQGSKPQCSSVKSTHEVAATLNVDADKENTAPQTATLAFTEASIPPRTPQRRGRSRKKEGKPGIPLFHVPGITNSQEPKEIKLVRTPNSKQAWAASSVARDQSSSPVRHYSPKLLQPQHITHNQAAYASTQSAPSALPLSSKVPERPHPTPSRVPPPSVPPSSHPLSSPYKTAFPILSRPAPAFVPARPVFHEAAQTPVRGARLFAQMPTSARAATAPMPAPPPHFRASFIDPREVIAYHTKKQTFSSIRSTSGFRSIKPLPVLQLPTPLSKQVSEEVTRPKEVPTQPVPVPKPEKPLEPAPVKPELKKFEGYLKQEEINDEVYMLVHQLSHSADKLTQANAHLLAAVGKKASPKPRMVDAGAQVEKKEEEEEEEDFREKLTTKPLPPPPDIFDRVRKEVFSPSRATASNEFLHVGEVSIDEVSRGLPHKPMTVAEAHLKAAKQQPVQDMSHVVGFPDVEKQDEHPGSSLIKHVEDARKVAKVREVTRDRWTSVMQNMGAQLNAMDAMARHMDEDFKTASRLVDAIDTMQEIVSPEIKVQRTKVRDEVSKMTSYDSARYSPPRSVPHPDYLPAAYPDYLGYPEYSDNLSHLTSMKTDSYKKRLEEAYNLAVSQFQSSPVPSVPSTYEEIKIDEKPTSQTRVSLDDIRSESFEEEERILSSIEHEIRMENDASTCGTSPRSSPRATALGRSGKAVARGKSWQQRSEKEKQKVREWMKKKQRERSAKYRNELRSLQEAEAHPFHSTGQTRSTRSLRLAADKRKEKQRAMLSSHMNARLDDSVHLMEEIQDDVVAKKQSLRSPLHDVNGRHMTQMKTSSYRKTPYPKQTRHPPIIHSVRSSDNFDNVSNSSILSSWSLNDDVKRLLYGNSRKSKVKGQVTFDLRSHRSSDVHSRGTASLLDEMDWQAVDALVASLDDAV